MTRRLRIAVLRLLRPAEAATRRLIIALARDVRVVLPQQREPKPQPAPAVPMWSLGWRPASPPPVPLKAPRPAAIRQPVFQLLDPRCNPLRKRSRRRGSSFPRITGFGPDASPRDPIPQSPSPHDRVDATRLAARLSVLGQALDDLPAQARRFARWLALNARRPERDARRRGPVSRLSPLRFGPPMALRGRAARRRNRHEVYEVLADTHSMALYALERRDTS